MVTNEHHGAGEMPGRSGQASRLRFLGERLRLNESDVAFFEQSLGASLATEYREFLLQVNGGAPIPNVAVGQSDFELSVDVFLALGGFRSGTSDVNGFDQASAIWDLDEIPLVDGDRRFLRIATSLEEHDLLLSLDGPQRGAIHAWFNHPDPPGFHATDCHLLFHAFDHLIASLVREGRTHDPNPFFGWNENGA